MASESEVNEMQSFLERLISSRERDRELSMFISFLLGFTSFDPGQTRPELDQTTIDPDHNSSNHSSPVDHHRRDRIIMINPLTRGMVVIEGTGLDSLLRGVQGKDGPPPASKSSIEAMPRVEIREGEEGECVICLDEWDNGETVKEMPCKHRFHCGCIEKWLGLHGSCPVCRFRMPVEEDEPGKKGEEREEGEEETRRGQREIWVRFLFGSGRRRNEEKNIESGSGSSDPVSQSGLGSSDPSSDPVSQSGLGSNLDEDESEDGDNEMEN